jgi:hypothetical protein
MVCDERTRPGGCQLSVARCKSHCRGLSASLSVSQNNIHSSLTNRCNTHDLPAHVSRGGAPPPPPGDTVQRRPAPAAQSWRGSRTCCPAPVARQHPAPPGPRAPVPTCVGAELWHVDAFDIARVRPMLERGMRRRRGRESVVRCVVIVAAVTATMRGLAVAAPSCFGTRHPALEGARDKDKRIRGQADTGCMACYH